jgi:hypothetical protein
LVVSETGLVYTFTTVKLQPIVTKPEGKNLIQACLNAPDPQQENAAAPEFTDRRGSSLPEPEAQEPSYADERQVRVKVNRQPSRLVSLNLNFPHIEAGTSASTNELFTGWLCPSSSSTN